jgi:peptide/nickel transport system ATP-binding protein/oligopeptide transport system ATP-binding protein
MTIGVSVAEPLVVHGSLAASEREARVDALLQHVGLSERHARRYPYELSGGELQRAAIARALTTNPTLVVCDEPVAALDMSVRAQVLNLMRDLQEELDLAYLFISHDLSLVRVIAHDVAVMYQGAVIEYGPADQIFEDPQQDYTKALLAAVPVPDPRQRHAWMRTEAELVGDREWQPAETSADDTVDAVSLISDT